jgi:hypothetical protein
MAIASVSEKSGYVFVYDERGRQLCAVPKGTGARDGLVGYTGTSFSVRRGSYIFTYNEKGKQIGSHPG